MTCKICKQFLACLGYLGNSSFKHRLIPGRWLLESADLSDELERGAVKFIRSRRFIWTAKSFDASAHREWGFQLVNPNQCSLLLDGTTRCS